MAGYTPSYGPPGREPHHVGSRNGRHRDTVRASSGSQGSTDYRHEPRQEPEDAMTRDLIHQSSSQKSQSFRKRKGVAAQIRSLEKLLTYPNTKMTAVVRQEKGRELASLVLERERKRAKEREKKNLGKYHMVRFVERQKCEKRLKRLRKTLLLEQGSRRRRVRQATGELTEAQLNSDTDRPAGVTVPGVEEAAVEQQIKQTEVDLNYTIYAPLGDKYISLFPPTGKEKISGMSKVSKVFLQPDQEAEVRALKDDNVIHNNTGEKPPMWYRVRDCMENGTLEQLRDGKLTVAPHILPQIGGKRKVAQRASQMPDWLNDDGEIAPEHIHTEEDSDDDDDNDERMDGGFFA